MVKRIYSFWGVLLAMALFGAGCRAFKGISSIQTKKQEPPERLLYVLSGQSNMDGQTPITDAIKQIKVPKAKIFCLRQYQFKADEEVLKSDQPMGKWVDLEACGAEPFKTFGPEVTFAAQMAVLKPKAEIYIIKFAHGGTAMGCEWQPEPKSGVYPKYGDKACNTFIEKTNKTPDALRAYKRLLKVYQMGLAALAQNGIRPKLAGFLWLQGEGDADGRIEFKFLSETYQENLEHFIKSLRRDLIDPNLPFVIGKIKCGYNKAEWDNKINPLEVVRSAQEAMTIKLEKVGSIETFDLNFQADGCHFDAASIEEIGKRYARKIVTLL